MRMVRRGNAEVQTLPEPVPPAKLTHEIAAEEAARTAERYLNLVMDNERLTNDRDSWRNHAQTCEAEIGRLQAREKELSDTLASTRAELERDRDLYRLRLVRLVAQFETAGSIVLKCLEAAKSQAPDVNLHALATKLPENAEAEHEQAGASEDAAQEERMTNGDERTG